MSAVIQSISRPTTNGRNASIAAVQMFELTGKLDSLVVDRPLTSRLAELSDPVLSRLSDDTRLSCYLSIADDGELLVVSGTTASISYGLSVPVGCRRPIFGTSAGAGLLSTLLPQELRQTLSRLEPDASSKALNAFERQVETCRRDGCLDMFSSETRSIRELSAPLAPPGAAWTLGAITVPYMANEKLDNRRSNTAAHLLVAAKLLSERIAIVLPRLASRASMGI